ncbi:hypothetical protein C2E21_8412 [Chlorella sorokiniana]|uniref:Uncharacterized protein n=1 Tax=Chlorella sorokiniana TaxID=3076 RepID=A0A2P6TEL4_CHLSO|nr:hypothetical protein C2E21_8412 [Chlorella sorokiniana]|eukprot:PRW21086.1 hypothetical protein C2E21_8412 [Chlorella sorokiniana]
MPPPPAPASVAGAPPPDTPAGLAASASAAASNGAVHIRLRMPAGRQASTAAAADSPGAASCSDASGSACGGKQGSGGWAAAEHEAAHEAEHEAGREAYFVEWQVARMWRRPEGLIVIWLLTALLVGIITGATTGARNSQAQSKRAKAYLAGQAAAQQAAAPVPTPAASVGGRPPPLPQAYWELSPPPAAGQPPPDDVPIFAPAPAPLLPPGSPDYGVLPPWVAPAPQEGPLPARKSMWSAPLVPRPQESGLNEYNQSCTCGGITAWRLWQSADGVLFEQYGNDYLQETQPITTLRAVCTGGAVLAAVPLTAGDKALPQVTNAGVFAGQGVSTLVKLLGEGGRIIDFNAAPPPDGSEPLYAGGTFSFKCPQAGWVIAGFALETFVVPVPGGVPVQRLFNIRIQCAEPRPC